MKWRGARGERLSCPSPQTPQGKIPPPIIAPCECGAREKREEGCSQGVCVFLVVDFVCMTAHRTRSRLNTLQEELEESCKCPEYVHYLLQFLHHRFHACTCMHVIVNMHTTLCFGWCKNVASCNSHIRISGTAQCSQLNFWHCTMHLTDTQSGL